MIDYSKKKGAAIAEYALVAILFAVVVGLAIFDISPGVLKTYFINSMGASSSNGNSITLSPMGE